MRYVISGVVSLLIIGAGAAIIAITVIFPQDTIDAVEAEAPAPATNVRVEVLEAERLADELLLTGRLFPWQEAVLSAETTGTLEWQGVEEGQFVEKSQELFHVDTTTLQTTYSQAKSRHDLAVQALDRAQNLRARGVASQESLDQAITERNLAQAELESVSVRLRKSTIHAPFSGFINEIMKENAEFVDAGTPLVELIQIDPIKATIPVPEGDIRFFDAGGVVALTIEALPGESFSGTIHRIATSADPITRTFNVEVSVPNTDRRLRPGMTVRATLVRRTIEDAVVVPLFAILSLENQRFVALEENGIAHVRQVEVGRIHGDRVHITSGLQPGDRLIVAGQRDLREGQAVNVVTDGAPK